MPTRPMIRPSRRARIPGAQGTTTNDAQGLSKFFRSLLTSMGYSSFAFKSDAPNPTSIIRPLTKEERKEFTQGLKEYEQSVVTDWQNMTVEDIGTGRFNIAVEESLAAQSIVDQLGQMEDDQKFIGRNDLDGIDRIAAGLLRQLKQLYLDGGNSGADFNSFVKSIEDRWAEE